MAFVKVAEAEQIAEGSGIVVEAGGRELAVFHVESGFYCLDNSCPHLEGPLGEGFLEGDIVLCPWHAWPFNVRTGEGMYGLGVCVPTYPCKLEAGSVLVDI